VGGIDLVMLVIAADEGVMPQTREHLAICQLLQVASGLVVLTKMDLAEPEWLELVKDDVATLLRGSFLDGAPILAVSAKTGEGLDGLRRTLAELARRVPSKSTDAIPRLPIDRVFTVKGFGTVVTGTLTRGQLAVDDRVEIFPRGLESKVRGLQCHNHSVERAVAGQRTAVNLQGVERSALFRGDVLSLPGALSPSHLVDVTLELLKDAPRPIKSRDRVRVHIGTSEIMARVLLVDRAEMEPGGTTHARLRLEAPLVALPGDRYVIRSYSPMVTIGGGTLLDVAPPRFKRKAPQLLAHLRLLEHGTPEEIVDEQILQDGLRGVRASELRARTPFGPERLKQLLELLLQSNRIVAVDRDWFIHRQASEQFKQEVTSVLAAYHAQHPLKRGIGREDLRGRAGHADERIFSYLLNALERDGLVKAERDKVRLASYQIKLSPEQERLMGQLEADFRDSGAAPPGPEEALAKRGLSGAEENEIFQLLVEEKRLIRIKESLFFHAEVLREAQERLVEFLRAKGEITPGDMKDLLGVTRKYAIPLMEYFDSQGITRRVGDRRVLR
jgi:selenocysteine-specific elongation factor